MILRNIPVSPIALCRTYGILHCMDRHSPKVSLRLQPDLARASEKAAAEMGLSIGEWLRDLAEEATGVKAEVKRGFAAMSQRNRRRTSRLGAQTRWSQSEATP